MSYGLHMWCFARFGTICTIKKNLKNTHGWRSFTYKPATLLKVTFFDGCFSRFLNCTNGTQSCNASHKDHGNGLSRLLKIRMRKFGIYSWNMAHEVVIITGLEPSQECNCFLGKNYPASSYLIKVSNGHHSGVFIVNFEHISICSGVSVVDFAQVHAGWVAVLS